MLKQDLSMYIIQKQRQASAKKNQSVHPFLSACSPYNRCISICCAKPIRLSLFSFAETTINEYK